MKRIQVASDLHWEFLNSQQSLALKDSFTGDADILVLAGDIVPLKFVDQVRDVLGWFCERYDDVVYVTGNHEYYGTDVESARLVLGAVRNELHNLHVLNNGIANVQGQKFYGGTMWFPDILGNDIIKPMLNDFALIKGFEPWCYRLNDEFRSEGLRLIDNDTIVVSHHLPLYDSVDPRYRTGNKNDISLNRFFVSDELHIIAELQPKLWIHGHTHHACDYTIGETRVICNPRGYPREKSGYQNVFIDV